MNMDIKKNKVVDEIVVFKGEAARIRFVPKRIAA
jgi:hypothetical protein